MQQSSLSPVREMDAPAPPVKILLVDDHRGNLCALEAVLADLGHCLIEAVSANEALRLLAEDDYAVVLLAVEMRDLDVCELARLIRGQARSRHTPIMFLSS